MTKQSKKKKQQPTTIGVIVAIIIAVIAALQSAQKTNAPAPTGVMTQTFMTATAAPATQASSATTAPTIPSNVTRPPTLIPPTNPPGLEITPINGALYEITGSVGGLGCPDSRCKEVAAYKKGNIVVVTGSVIGTTYKAKKTKVWYQILSHDGSRVYVYGEYVTPHDSGSR